MHISKNVSIKCCHIFKKNENGHFILDFYGSDLSKMDQTWSNWISHKSKNVTIKSCHIYNRDKKGCFIGTILFMFSDQICPKWIKLDQTCSNLISHQSKNVTIKTCHIYKRMKMAVLFQIFLDQIFPKWIKLDQTWSMQIGFLANQKMLV